MAKIKFVINDVAPTTGGPPPNTVTPEKELVKLEPGDTILFEAKTKVPVYVRTAPGSFLGLVDRERFPNFTVIKLDSGELHVEFKDPTGGGPDTVWPS